MATEVRNRWIVRVAAVLAFFGLFCANLLPTTPRTSPDTLGDFKLVYASTSGLLHSGDAYGYGELSRAFHDAGCTQPPDWYGRNPVYPYFTLLTISPVLWVPMLTASYAWGCMNYLVLALTALRLTRYAERSYRSGLGWRLAMIGVMAASPLVSFGLDVANLSVLSACLCIFAVTAEPEERQWVYAFALAFALLLKPHLAFWVVVALFLLRRKPEQTLAWRASGLFSVTALAMTVYLICRHQFFPLMSSYSAMLHKEAAGGSMDFRNPQNYLVPAQITALGTLLGHWISSLHRIAMLELIILPPIALALLLASLRASPSWKMVVVSAWVSFGFLVTYHRAHDGIFLFVLLPWAFACLKRRRGAGGAIAVLGFYALFSINVPGIWWRRLGNFGPLRPLADLLYDRQVATAALLICIFLIVILMRVAYLHRAASNHGVDELFGEPGRSGTGSKMMSQTL